MDKQTTLNPMSMTGDEAIMSALNSIIDKTPNGEQKKYKIGTAIILMLKRIKLRDLMMKQIKATELWKRYVRQQKKEKSKDPIIRNLMEIIPEPTDESLNNFKGKERKLVIRIPFIEEWWDDIDYLRHIDEVRTLFKITKEQLIDYIELYLKKTTLVSVLSNPTTTDENRSVRIGEVQVFMNKKIEKLRREKEFEFRQGIYYPTDLKNADFTQGEMQANRNMIFEKSNLIINSQYFPEDFEKNLMMTIGLGNTIEDMEEVEKQLRSFVHITDNGRRISREQDEVEFIKKYYIYFIHKPDALYWENMLNDMELTSTDINNKIFLEKPILPMNTLMKMVPATDEYSIGAPFELQTLDDRQMIFFFQMEIGLGESFNNGVLKKSRDLYNQKVKEASSKQKKHNPFAKTEADVEKEREEKLAAARARRNKKKKGKQKVAVVTKATPALYDDDALAAMFGEDSGSNTKGKKNKKNKKNKKKKKKKKQEEESQDDDKKPPAPQAKSGKISPTQLATAPLIKEKKDEKLYNYLKNVCGEKDEVQAIIWSVINKYLKNGSFGEKCYYSGGFATYLLTKGKYPTTDIDYKIYPPQQGEKVNEKYWENYLKENKDNIFKDIRESLPYDKKEYFNGILVGRPPGNIDGPIKITLSLSSPEEVRYNPPIKKFGMLVAIDEIDKKAYCDIAFWSEKDLINDLDLPFIDSIYPKHDEPLFKELDMYVIDKQFMIEEKKIFLKKLNNESMLHKKTNWENQLVLLEGLGKKGGGRKKRTRKKYQKGGTVESVDYYFGNLLTSLSRQHAVLDNIKARAEDEDRALTQVERSQRKEALDNIDRALIDHIKHFIKKDVNHITVKGKKTSWFQFGRGSTQSSVIYNYWKKYITEYCEGYGRGRHLRTYYDRCEMKKMTKVQKDGLNRLFNNYIYINIKSSQDTDWFDPDTKKFVDSKDSVFHRAKDEIRAEADCAGDQKCLELLCAGDQKCLDEIRAEAAAKAAKEKNGEGGRKKRTRRIRRRKKRRTKKKKKRTKKKRRKRRKKTRRRK